MTLTVEESGRTVAVVAGASGRVGAHDRRPVHFLRQARRDRSLSRRGHATLPWLDETERGKSQSRLSLPALRRLHRTAMISIFYTTTTRTEPHRKGGTQGVRVTFMQ